MRHDPTLTKLDIWLNLQILRADPEEQMSAKQIAKYEARAKVIKALAHPTRLIIVDELAEHGERCVCELTELVGTDMSTVSRHLAQLKQAGIVEDDKRGQMVYYRLRVKCLLKFFDCVESVIRCNAKSQQELLA
jgi:ArsR family transcriptional regulator